MLYYSRPFNQLLKHLGCPDPEPGAGHPLGEGGACAVVPSQLAVQRVPPGLSAGPGDPHRLPGEVPAHQARLQAQGQAGGQEGEGEGRLGYRALFMKAIQL